MPRAGYKGQSADESRFQSSFATDLFLCFFVSKRGSTGSKQTSKGLFICYLPTNPGSLGYVSAFLVRRWQI